MIAICADDTGVEISGTVDDLNDVHLAIMDLLHTGSSSVQILAASSDPSPYPRALSRLEVRRTEGRTVLSVVDGDLIASGSDDSLGRFASWFQFRQGACPGQHSHFEPAPDDLFHASESVPLVVSVRHSAA
jgi:hypothetical protein